MSYFAHGKKLKVKAQGLQRQVEQAELQYKAAVQDHQTFQVSFFVLQLNIGQRKYDEEIKKILLVTLTH